MYYAAPIKSRIYVTTDTKLIATFPRCTYDNNPFMRVLGIFYQWTSFKVPYHSTSYSTTSTQDGGQRQQLSVSLLVANFIFALIDESSS